MIPSTHGLRALLDSLALPSGRIILIHARIKGLQAYTGLSYGALTQTLVAGLQAYRPLSLLVPAYTIYGFLRSRLFHRRFSLSETGRFSEEIRQHIPCWRSPDPMYSLLDLNDYVPQLALDYSATFAPGGLFEHLYQQNAIILNIDMPGFWATPIHAIELRHQVNYRHLRQVSGILYLDETHWQSVNYTAYVRNMDANCHAYPLYDQRKRWQFLLEEQILHVHQQGDMYFSWGEIQTFAHSISKALSTDACFLLAAKHLKRDPANPWLT